VDVGVALEGFDHHAKQLLDVGLGGLLADAAVDDDGAGLQGWVELESEAVRKLCPDVKPLAAVHVFLAGLHDLEEGVGDGLEICEGHAVVLVA